MNMKYRIQRRNDLLENSLELICKCFFPATVFQKFRTISKCKHKIESRA